MDTDILIDFLRGHPQARRFLLEASEDGPLYCSAVTVAELNAGMRPGEEVATARLIGGLIVTSVSQPIAEVAGRLKFNARGQTTELADCLIAATALVESLALATRNARHYPFQELRVIVPDY